MRRKVPGIGERLATQVVSFVQSVRKQELYKSPGVAETIDWAEALGHLHTSGLDASTVNASLGLILKYQDDIDKVRGRVATVLVEQAISEA